MGGGRKGERGGEGRGGEGEGKSTYVLHTCSTNQSVIKDGLIKGDDHC